MERKSWDTSVSGKKEDESGQQGEKTGKEKSIEHREALRNTGTNRLSTCSCKRADTSNQYPAGGTE